MNRKTTMILALVASTAVLIAGVVFYIADQASPTPDPTPAATTDTEPGPDTAVPTPTTTASQPAPATATTPAVDWRGQAEQAIRDVTPTWATLPLRDGRGDIATWAASLEDLDAAGPDFVTQSTEEWSTLWAGVIQLGAYTSDPHITHLSFVKGDADRSTWRVDIARTIRFPSFPQLDYSDTNTWLIVSSRDNQDQRIESFTTP